MKWFKHMSDASSDEFMARLEDELGLEGIARWWKMLEAIATQMDKTDRCYAEYPIRRWMVLLSCKQRRNLETFIKVLQNFGKVSTNWSENTLKVECKKLLEFRDEYSRKSGVAPDKVAPETEEEVDTEKKDNPPTPLPGGGVTRSSDSPKPAVPRTASAAPDDLLMARFDDFYKSYLRKVGKPAARKAFSKAILLCEPDKIIAAAARFSKETEAEWRRAGRSSAEGMRYVPHPSRWLNDGRFMDYDDLPQPLPDGEYETREQWAKEQFGEDFQLQGDWVVPAP